jgi:hypothetical protein
MRRRPRPATGNKDMSLALHSVGTSMATNKRGMSAVLRIRSLSFLNHRNLSDRFMFLTLNIPAMLPTALN